MHRDAFSELRAGLALPLIAAPMFLVSGPALVSAACRAGACPWPAGSTLPMITSCTSSPAMPARAMAARIATAPSSLAQSEAKSP